MPSRRLSPRRALDVALSAVVARNLLTKDPGPVLDELRALAGDDQELLAEVAGTCSGWYEAPETITLCAALAAEIDGAAPWVQVGRRRGARGDHRGPEGRC